MHAVPKAEETPCTISPGHGLIETGWCVLKFAYCPVCMEKLKGETSYLKLEGLDVNVNGTIAPNVLIPTHINCVDKPSADAYPEPDVAAMSNIVRLFHEFNSTILV